MRILLCSIYFLLSTFAVAQKSEIKDSCLQADYYNDLAEKSRLSNSNSSIKYSKKALKASEFCNDKNKRANALLNLGTGLDLAADYTEALKNTRKALKIFRERSNKTGEAKSLYQIGKIYFHQSESSNEQSKTDYYNESLTYYRLALKIERQLKNPTGIAENQIEIGRILFSLQKPDSALIILKSVLAESEKSVSDPEIIHNVAKSSYNIALIYIEQKNYKEAVRYLEKAAFVDSVLKNKEGLAVIRMAEMYLEMGNFDKANQLAVQGLDTALRYGYPLRVMQASHILHQALAKNGNFEKAYGSLMVYNQMSDSLKNDEYIKELTQIKMKHDFEKEKAQKEIQNKARIEKQKLITYSVVIVLALVIIFLIYGVKTYRQKQKANVILVHQKEEIEGQKNTLETQYSILEEQKREITDSINYAKRIQKAILPPNKLVKEYLKDSFILYKPKDIVAGDFYWMECKDDRVLFAAADCTGHGVPGAMVSVVCNNGLNRSVREYGLTDPGEILDKTREIVIQEFAKSEEDVQDGMDIAICSIEGNKLHYAGANNPLWIIRNGEILETKANKQPIGKCDTPVPFTTHSFELQKGDSIYIFSDGFVDQFGGERGKKFMAKGFKELLLGIQDLTMEEQQIRIDMTFENWKVWADPDSNRDGKRSVIEQIDDVCIIGVRI